MSPRRPDTGRTERIELRLTAEERDLLLRAAELSGEDVSALVRRAAILEARRLLKLAGE